MWSCVLPDAACWLGATAHICCQEHQRNRKPGMLSSCYLMPHIVSEINANSLPYRFWGKLLCNIRNVQHHFEHPVSCMSNTLYIVCSCDRSWPVTRRASPTTRWTSSASPSSTLTGIAPAASSRRNSRRASSASDTTSETTDRWGNSWGTHGVTCDITRRVTHWTTCEAIGEYCGANRGVTCEATCGSSIAALFSLSWLEIK